MMWRRGHRDRELDEELRAHLEMATRDRVGRGEDPVEAAAAARREFGNLGLVQETTREMWGWSWADRFAQDARYGLRLLRRAPAFSIVAVLSLAVGIGVNAAIFNVINAVRLRMLPIPRPSELVEITPVSMEGARGNFSSWRQALLSNPIWEAVRDHQQVFNGMLAYGGSTYNLAHGGEERPARALIVSGSFFDVLAVRPERGRLFTTADDHRGCAPRAVISHGFWKRELGGDPGAVGRTIELDSHTVEIVGITPPSFFGLEVGRTFDVAVLICADPILAGGPSRLDSGTDWWLTVMGRLKPGTTIDAATAHLEALSPSIFRATLKPNYPAVSVSKYLAMKLHTLPASTGVSRVREDYERPLTLLLGLGVVVLLIASANIASLMLARASAREREIAVRLGLGASRSRVIRQLLTESLIICAMGAAGGLVLARTLSTALVTFVDDGTKELVLGLDVDWRVTAFTAGLAALTCMLFGVVPAIRGTRVGPGALLNGAGRRVTEGRDGASLRRALVVAQVALSMVLLFGAVVFTRTLRNLANVDAGFAREGIVMTGFDLRQVVMPGDERIAYKQTVLERLRATAGVDAAAATSLVPLSGDAWGNDVKVQGPTGPTTVNSRFNRVSPSYFETFRIPLIAGRDFDARVDTLAATRVAIVDQTLASAAGGQALGAWFEVEATPSQPATSYQIIGIVADSKYLSLREERAPVVYLPMSQDPKPGRWVLAAVRTRIEPAVLTGAVVQSFKEMDPNIVLSFTVLDTAIEQTLIRERLMAVLSVFFGSIAAALAVVGLYGLIAYTVTRRTKEIGVRMALGASRARIASMIVGEAGVLVAIGLVAGLVLVLLSAELAQTLLFGLRPRDPLSIALSALLLGTVGLLAGYVPAAAASRIEPNIALRVE